MTATMNNLPPMLPLPEPAGVMDITTDYVGYVGTFKVWTEHSVRAYAESERQQVAAAKDQEIARLTAEISGPLPKAWWVERLKAQEAITDKVTAERDNLREQVNALEKNLDNTAEQVEIALQEWNKERDRADALAARVAELEAAAADAIESIDGAESGHARNTLREALPAAPDQTEGENHEAD